MIRRILLFATAVLVLTSILLFSQLRLAPRKVSGFIEADEIRIGSRVGGRIAEVLIEEGARVEQDQILIKLEPFDLRQREQEAIATWPECGLTQERRGRRDAYRRIRSRERVPFQAKKNEEGFSATGSELG